MYVIIGNKFSILFYLMPLIFRSGADLENPPLVKAFIISITIWKIFLFISQMNACNIKFSETLFYQRIYTW